MGVVYLDASAAVKFVVPERESAALAVALKPDDALVASEILEVELGRACLRRGMPPAAATPILDLVALLPVTEIRERAALTQPPVLRALDAIHLAAALAIEADLLLAYDLRLLDAARAAGLTVASPGA
jgi:predicted nucleic acid-binding protein